MTRADYAKQINWNGMASRMIKTNELPSFEIGQTINPGMCWTDGGEFKVETKGQYAIIFDIIENLDGHAVDYDSEAETESIGATDCNCEKEILINRNFEVVDFWAWDEETQFAKVFIKAI